MLKVLFHGQLQLGLAQAAAAALAALTVVILAGRRGIHLEKDLAIAMVRGLAQIVAVGSILLLLLKAPSWTSIFLLSAMIVAAGATSAKRAKGMPGAFEVSTWAIGGGAGLMIAIMTLLGVIDTPITALVPIGSMMIANAMNTNGLASVSTPNVPDAATTGLRKRNGRTGACRRDRDGLGARRRRKDQRCALCAGIVRSEPDSGN